MEGLQLAQMLADLSDLHAAEPDTAKALVTVNKTISRIEEQQEAAKSTTSGGGGTGPPTGGVGDELLSHHAGRLLHQAHAGAASSQQRTASPAARHLSGFDMLGRRILTPPMTRTNSSSSMPGTPRREFEDHDDVERAATLMALYDIRSKLRQQDNSSLIKAREKINALAAKQQAQAAAATASAEKKDAAAGEVRHHVYTYPR